MTIFSRRFKIAKNLISFFKWKELISEETKWIILREMMGTEYLVVVVVVVVPSFL